MPGVVCGRFDFKGTTGMDGEARMFIQHLDVPPPPASPRLNARLSHILDALKQRAKPTLLIFDTYQAAGEAEEWVERQLLSTLIRATWLRVVIVGQSVPPITGTIWEAETSPLISLKKPRAADWFEYGKQHCPELTLDDVETFCRYTDKATVLAQLLGPKI